MHWLGRTVAAVVAGAATGCLVFAGVAVAGNVLMGGRNFGGLAAGLLTGLLTCTLTAMMIFHRLSSSHNRPDAETRCRQCDYILRGITEPRCPECGERI